MGETIINIRGNIQIEKVVNEKTKYKFIVKWIDSCTYTLTPTKKTCKEFPNLPQNTILIVKFIQINENSYIETTSSNTSDFKDTSEIFKIE